MQTLTETEIQAINAQPIRAGDWALISLQPFTSEETLTVTMNGGEIFTVKVTDAQIIARVITADGEDYIITVTYGPEAESIIKSLDKKLTTVEEHTTDSFQILLQTIVYPFLFTVDILKSAGKSEAEATQFVKNAWDRFISSTT